jgi:beta-lactamase class A
MYVYSPYNRSQPKPQPKNRRWVFGLCAVLLIVMGAYKLEAPRIAKAKEESAAIKAELAKPKLSETQAIAMTAKINGVLAANPNMDIGVSIQDLNSGKQYDLGEDAAFVAASTAKVLTANLFLSRVESGQYNLNQTVGGQTASAQLQAMIVDSDNDAWHALNDLMGHPALLSYAQKIGLKNYDPDKNTLTVSDITTLLAKLYKKQLLNKTNTDLLLGYMKQANEDSYIVADVPNGVTVYHKAGWLDDRVHDAAIIDNGKHPYVLTIFTKTMDKSDYPGDQGHQIFADITAATTAAFL